MTGTVTGVTTTVERGRRVARDVPKLFDDFEPIPVRNWGRRSGSRLSGRFRQFPF
jgi:hypothetical protein